MGTPTSVFDPALKPPSSLLQTSAPGQTSSFLPQLTVPTQSPPFITASTFGLTSAPLLPIVSSPLTRNLTLGPNTLPPPPEKWLDNGKACVDAVPLNLIVKKQQKGQIISTGQQN